LHFANASWFIIDVVINTADIAIAAIIKMILPFEVITCYCYFQDINFKKTIMLF